MLPSTMLPSTRRPSWATIVLLCAAFALVAVPAAAAQESTVCLPELESALPPERVSDAVVAVSLLGQMARLAEPALPALRGDQGPIPAGEPGADAARYLHQRHLLPADWSVATHDDEAWRVMVREFAWGYRAHTPPLSGGGRDGMLNDAARTMVAVSAALRPLAVFATDAAGDVTFFAVVLNWTPIPRLVLVRHPEGLALGPGTASVERAAPVLEAMSGCAFRFESFVYATEDIALRMFVQQGESIMRVLASEPPSGEWPVVIPAERVIDAFRFDDPALAGLEAVAVAIEGPSIGIGTAITVLATVRTNLNLEGILYHLAFP
jgi:hypothetical protein